MGSSADRHLLDVGLCGCSLKHGTAVCCSSPVILPWAAEQAMSSECGQMAAAACSNLWTSMGASTHGGQREGRQVWGQTAVPCLADGAFTQGRERQLSQLCLARVRRGAPAPPAKSRGPGVTSSSSRAAAPARPEKW